MAILNNGFLDGFKGKLGPATGTRWRKKSIIKSRSRKKIKKENLLPQHFKLRALSGFLKLFKKSIQIGFYDKRNRDNVFNSAIAQNLENGLTGEAPDYVINYKKIIFSKGKREPAWAAKAILQQENLLRITWEIPETAKLKVLGNDLAQIIVYSEKYEQELNFPPGLRSDRSLTIIIPKVHTGSQLHVWIFFVSPDGKSVSNSDYLGTV